MMWFELYNGWMCKFEDGSDIAFRILPHTWALPLRVEWLNGGKGCMKNLVIGVLCFEIDWGNGKPPF